MTANTEDVEDLPTRLWKDQRSPQAKALGVANESETWQGIVRVGDGRVVLAGDRRVAEATGASRGWRLEGSDLEDPIWRKPGAAVKVSNRSLNGRYPELKFHRRPSVIFLRHKLGKIEDSTFGVTHAGETWLSPVFVDKRMLCLVLLHGAFSLPGLNRARRRGVPGGQDMK